MTVVLQQVKEQIVRGGTLNIPEHGDNTGLDGIKYLVLGKGLLDVGNSLFPQLLQVVKAGPGRVGIAEHRYVNEGANSKWCLVMGENFRHSG